MIEFKTMNKLRKSVSNAVISTAIICCLCIRTTISNESISVIDTEQFNASMIQCHKKCSANSNCEAYTLQKTTNSTRSALNTCKLQRLFQYNDPLDMIYKPNDGDISMIMERGVVTVSKRIQLSTIPKFTTTIESTTIPKPTEKSTVPDSQPEIDTESTAISNPTEKSTVPDSQPEIDTESTAISNPTEKSTVPDSQPAIDTDSTTISKTMETSTVPDSQPAIDTESTKISNPTEKSTVTDSQKAIDTKSTTISKLTEKSTTVATTQPPQVTQRKAPTYNDYQITAMDELDNDRYIFYWSCKADGCTKKAIFTTYSKSDLTKQLQEGFISNVFPGCNFDRVQAAFTMDGISYFFYKGKWLKYSIETVGKDQIKATSKSGQTPNLDSIKTFAATTISGNVYIMDVDFNSRCYGKEVVSSKKNSNAPANEDCKKIMKAIDSDPKFKKTISLLGHDYSTITMVSSAASEGEMLYLEPHDT